MFRSTTVHWLYQISPNSQIYTSTYSLLFYYERNRIDHWRVVSVLGIHGVCAYITLPMKCACDFSSSASSGFLPATYKSSYLSSATKHGSHVCVMTILPLPPARVSIELFSVIMTCAAKTDGFTH